MMMYSIIFLDGDIYCSKLLEVRGKLFINVFNTSKAFSLNSLSLSAMACFINFSIC